MNSRGTSLLSGLLFPGPAKARTPAAVLTDGKVQPEEQLWTYWISGRRSQILNIEGLKFLCHETLFCSFLMVKELCLWDAFPYIMYVLYRPQRPAENSRYQPKMLSGCNQLLLQLDAIWYLVMVRWVYQAGVPAEHGLSSMVCYLNYLVAYLTILKTVKNLLVRP